MSATESGSTASIALAPAPEPVRELDPSALRPRDHFVVEHAPRLLVARFAEPQRTVSWAIVGGGLTSARAVAWIQIADADLAPPVDPCELARSRLAAAGIPDAIALLTSRDVGTYVDVHATHGEASCRCIATVGLGNALRAGDPPGLSDPAPKVGTINVLCHSSVPLTDEAMLEALALASEARAVAMREVDVPSRISGLPASGTGTDCIAIAAPAAGEPQRYAGKHTVTGHLIGHTVHAAVRDGAARWLREHAGARDAGA